jgi:hypothetical protein
LFGLPLFHITASKHSWELDEWGCWQRMKQ